MANVEFDWEGFIADCAEDGITFVFVEPEVPRRSWWRRLIGGSR